MCYLNYIYKYITINESLNIIIKLQSYDLKVTDQSYENNLLQIRIRLRAIDAFSRS